VYKLENVVNLFISSWPWVYITSENSLVFVMRSQLSDAIGYIGHEDFPEKWPDLIPALVGKFQSGDFHIINGVLHTTHSLFKRLVNNVFIGHNIDLPLCKMWFCILFLSI
jgi:hypothetical protein